MQVIMHNSFVSLSLNWGPDVVVSLRGSTPVLIGNNIIRPHHVCQQGKD